MINQPRTIDTYIVEIRSMTDAKIGDCCKDIQREISDMLPNPNVWVYCRRVTK